MERGAVDPAALEVALRLTHTLKGAARLVNAEPVQRVAHAMEDLFLQLTAPPPGAAEPPAGGPAPARLDGAA